MKCLTMIAIEISWFYDLADIFLSSYLSLLLFVGGIIS